jgi:hypothetical protein
MKRAARTIVVAFAGLCLLPACDEFPEFRHAGVTVQGPQIHILFVLCSDDVVKKVELLDIKGDALVGDPNDKILWGISSEAGSRQEDYIVDRTPPGFVEFVHLARPLPTEHLSAYVKTAQVAAAASFDLSELKSGQVRNGKGQMLSPTGFRQAATCH